MQALKLPKYDLKARDGTILCLVRKKWVSLTPEEWVRQHFLNLLIAHLGYPRGMIKLEKTVYFFKEKKRSDIVVLDPQGTIFLLIECKSAKIKLDQKTVNQVSVYNKILNAGYFAITNGISHFIWKKNAKYFEQIQDFPSYTF